MRGGELTACILVCWSGWSPVMVHMSVLMCTAVVSEYVYAFVPSCIHMGAQMCNHKVYWHVECVCVCECVQVWGR